MNKNSHTGSNPGKLTSTCWIQTNTSRIVFSLSRAALNTIFVLLRANFKSSHNYFLSTRAHCHVLEPAGSCSSSPRQWGEVRQGGPALPFPSPGRAVQATGSLGAPFSATTGTFEATFSPYNTLGSLLVYLQQLSLSDPSNIPCRPYRERLLLCEWPLSPLRGGPCMEAGARPLLQCCVPLGKTVPAAQASTPWCRTVTWAFLRSGFSQKQGSGIPSQLCCL